VTRTETRRAAKTAVYLESGMKRTFACAVEWPGWCRSGRDEAGALDALVGSGSRYGRALARTRLGFIAPSDVAALDLVAHHRGDATTDFGAPGAVPKADERPMGDADLERYSAILRSCWRAFDAAVQSARGKTLAKGPRGGGRSLHGIVDHVVGAELGYLSALGWKTSADADAIDAVRDAVIAGMAASARGEIPAVGPRGGKRWKPRFFARRLAWHALDHAWEIEDRLRGHKTGRSV
jgi:hypothetical protein